MNSFNYQLKVSDLKVSVIDNKITLRSNKLKKEIIPMLSCSHDYVNSPLPVYQFLCDLSAAEKRTKIGFSWGSLVSIHRFFPRVLYRNVIISKAKWIFDESVILELIDLANPIHQKVTKWRDEYDLPSLVNLVQNDYPLTINLDNSKSIETLFDAIRNTKWFSLEEFLFTESTPIKDKKNNSYSNELVISLGLR